MNAAAPSTAAAAATPGEAGAADAAEVLMRKIMTDTRDEVLAYMAKSHSDVVDLFRQQVY